MKIWIKLLIGIVIGVILGIIIPMKVGGDFFDSISRIFINIGRYAVYPLIFFSLVVGTYELRLERNFLRTYGYMFFYLMASTVILVIIGVLSGIAFMPDALQNTPGTAPEKNAPGLQEMLLGVFPRNMFSAIVGDGDFLLPLVVFAIIFGAHLASEKDMSKPVVQLMDTLSRIFYNINSLLVEVFGIALIGIISASVIHFIDIGASIPNYQQLILILAIDVAIVVFGVFPLLFYFLTDRKNPYKYLYSITAPLLTALATGDANISMSMLIKHSKENLSVPRTIGSSTYPIFAMFGKGGTALITSVTFIVIIKSIKQSGIDFFDAMWVIGFSTLVSFHLSTFPGAGTITAIGLLCKLYGKGYQSHWVIVEDIAPILICFGAVIDVAAAAFSSFLLSYQRGVKSKIEARDYI